MNPRLALSLGKACVAGAAAVFAFDVLDSIFLFIVGSHTLDFAGGKTKSLNFLKGFTLYVTPGQYWLFVGTLALAAILFLLGVLCYTRVRRAARGVTEMRDG
jgi:ectoine hydroxylase-related dioxygenase (phytanoyl-CoA dioxygenase family)